MKRYQTRYSRVMAGRVSPIALVYVVIKSLEMIDNSSANMMSDV